MLHNLLTVLRDKFECFNACFIEIYKLKSVNEPFGHHVGDNYIKLVVSELMDGYRDDECIRIIVNKSKN
ncbi:diguanylate cyclase [Shewanella sp. D64]|uniref:diguanylate cyclase domain-containing protein n=1 Tax=unclassified Shewanella TaxID=196818 RepID=UPI002DD75CD8|nr:diguanylate cyclase [Shewanella sp. D64]MEC4738268.1 diguanylate cyclase [Shewanella sp. E94]WBJ95406.1 diguanylate cyclase [Shewanella sp. MTB7]